jgi:hypothetical protein
VVYVWEQSKKRKRAGDDFEGDKDGQIVKDMVGNKRRKTSMEAIARRAQKKMTYLSFLLTVAWNFWEEIGSAMYMCLSPRNFSDAKKEKKLRRIFLPKLLFRHLIASNLNKMAPTLREIRRTKRRTRRTWSVTTMENLQEVLQPASLYREWPKVSFFCVEFLFFIY